MAALLHEALGELRTLPMRHHPPRGLAAEDVEDCVQLEVSRFVAGHVLEFVAPPAKH